METVRPQIDIPEPEKYPEMANDDIQGADTAARYFLDLYGYVYNTGDLKTWNKVVDPSCALCTAIAQQVEELYAKGDWFEGVARLHAEALVYYPTDDDPSYLVVLRVVSAPHKHFDAAGAVLTSTEEKTTPEYAVSVQYLAPNEWKVVGAGDLGSVK